MTWLKDDEERALMIAEDQCTKCEHLILFHDDGDGGYGSYCRVCLLLHLPNLEDGSQHTEFDETVEPRGDDP